MRLPPGQQTALPSAYSGRPELEALEHATHYNDHIVSCFAAVLGRAGGHRARVVDFGAGIGTLTRRFEARTGVRPEVVEPDLEQRLQLEREGLCCRASIDQFPEASFDLVISSNVLEHIADDVGTLRQIRSRLRPGGLAVFWVPAFPVLWTSLDDRVGHVRRYTRAGLQRAFREAGFEVESVQYQDSLGFVAALLYRVLPGSDAPLRPGAIRFYDAVLFPFSRALDRVTHPIFGKNLVLVGSRA